MSDQQPQPARQEYNEDEMRALFAQHNNKIIEHWSSPLHDSSMPDRVRGAVECVLATIEGNMPGMPEFSLSLVGSKVDDPVQPGMRDIPSITFDGDLVNDLQTYANPNHPLVNFRREFNALYGFDDDLIPDVLN